MSEEIESLYRQGEHCAGTGQYHDALANFHKAKSLLLSQSYQNFSSQNHSSSSSKLGVMMESITKSINRNTEILVKNPILALYLSRGYNTDDLKKKYRSLALQFHPGKLNTFI